MKNIFAYILIGAASLLLTSCTPSSAGAKHALPLTAAYSPLSQGLAKLVLTTTQAYEAKPEFYLRDVLKVSPYGGDAALFDGGSTRIFGLYGGDARYVQGTRPVAWSSNSDSLLVVDRDGFFYTVSRAGKLTEQAWLSDLFGRKFLTKDFAANGAIAGEGGLIAMLDGSRKRVLVADFDKHSHFVIDVGKSWQESHPASRLEIGWDAVAQSPAIFVSHQLVRVGGGNRLQITNRLEVYRADGTAAFAGTLQGLEVQFLPVLSRQGAMLLARGDNFRCLHALTGDGTLKTAQVCDQDIEAVSLDREGHPISFSPFLSAGRSPFPAYVGLLGEHSNAIPVASLSNGDLLLWSTTSRGATFIKLAKDGALIAPSSDVAAIDDAPPTIGRDIEARSADGLAVKGFFFMPQSTGRAKGLVVVVHGGPYAVASDQLSSPLAADFLRQGYAVVAVNYRGSPGYGRSYVEKGFGGGVSMMLSDTSALVKAALTEMHAAPNLPVVFYGRSFGGVLAARAMKETPELYASYVIESGVCDFNVSIDNVMMAGMTKSGLQSVYDPAVAAYNVQIASDQDGQPLNLNFCDARLPDQARLLVLHSKDDRIAPYAVMKQFADKQVQARTAMVSVERAGHAVMTNLRADNRQEYEAVSRHIIDFIGQGHFSVAPSSVASEREDRVNASH